VKAAVMLIEGTNCEAESKKAFERVGIEAELVHLKQFLGECPKGMGHRMSDFDALFFPGGWSAGDYVRAGAIFAARLKSKLGDEIKEFIEGGKPVVGVCNGFQILAELGVLPGFNGVSKEPEAVLAINRNNRFQCRPTYLKHENACKLTKGLAEGRILQVPVAHAEGRLTFGGKKEESLKKLEGNNQIIFRYCNSDGSEANGEFPTNPNGSLYDIAGISNPEGNVLGMMPHPERVMDGIQLADWTRQDSLSENGDGLAFFESIAEYIKRK